MVVYGGQGTFNLSWSGSEISSGTYTGVTATAYDGELQTTAKVLNTFIVQ
jgi:hypothetical protein